MPRHPRSIATVCMSGDLPDKLEAAAAVGFDGIEIFENDLLTFNGSPAEVRRMAEDLGLAITIFQPFRDFEAMPEPQRARNLDRAERKFDVMQALGTDLVLVCSNVQPACLDDPERAAADLREMAERAARRGLRVGYEALAWGRHTRLWRQAWDIVRRADHPALGLIVDSFHTLSLKDDPSGIAQLPGEKIFFVQLADAPLFDMDVLQWSRHYRNFPGQGQLPVTPFLKAVLDAGYAGPLSLEIFNDEFRAAPVRQTARDGLRSLILAESEARPGVPAAALPPAPRCHGVEFLEFAVNEPVRQELAGFLGTLGFRLAGRHRSKAVELYRQGGVSLVLNAEPDSAAAGHFEMHGPSVCAMALSVEKAEAALARAHALLCSTWQEPRGAGERPMPQLRAPDGSLICLVENRPGERSFWEDDFHLIPGVEGESGLLAVDHVAQALAPGQMDSFILFYRALFGMEPEGLWELPDPRGLVRSRAMVTPDRALRLPLNVSEARETATGRFVSAVAGAGVHHIAFLTADAAATARAMRARGAPLLPIPENYYDDLEARFGLEPARLDELRGLHLLHDQDAEGGVFTHAYTASFADRFFFEIVERQGGYRQFGAPNAGVRMAAQARYAGRKVKN
ncbi:sugar phosphate isomerase/epimerase and 4-hydroxyphenylpyruvate domain-containing protein [Roseomonas sp. GC11]|uniref:bifunctional sugar phosphate isomerase/epimerase/4-hydroxyphenylpyruvate dioxygenase family protein n=1 Tax=Roseomonas sp. GC11 TaxID=2950546 RepID=UPI00210AB1AB|nr:sugar phosphate isomerase/epimerase and 4-hydroxyphenylpyruvate domain-containing protein [Roseomonas sp. GC11]MCQ4159616.1 sugar phosphate isomerase/epimerase and 4-hydroxyphenylpyruvate domain-containing protein [Roseomonas sp. GC11]